MQNNNTHHGRQPASKQASPPTDPRTDPRIKRAEEQPAVKGICRDYIWGICQMSAQCKYRHKLDINVMKTVLKFCHDHQNRTGCLRPDCTYLHTSREEEVAFLTTGQVPLMLAERYTALQANETVQGMPCPNMTSSKMTGPSIPGPSMPGSSLAGPSMAPVPPPHLIYEYLAQPPPPPPPAPAPAHKSAPQLPIQRPQNMSQQIQGPQNILPQMQAVQNMPSLMQGPQNIPAQMQVSQIIPPQKQGPQNIPPQMQGPQNIPPQMQGPQNIPPQLQGLQNMPSQIKGPQMPSIMQAPLMPHHVGSMYAPPPPPPPTAATTTMQMPGPVYSAPMPSTSRIMPGMYQSHQPPVLPIFDPTRPPPPLPSINPHSQKRIHSEECEAGPTKVRKTESSLESCDACVQRLLRCNIYRQQVEFQQEQNEQLRLSISRKMENYESKKALLRSLARPESNRRTEEFLESTSFLHQLLEVFFDKPRSEPVQSEDFNSFLQTFVGRPRSNTNGQATTDTIEALVDIITSSPSDRSAASESRVEDKARNAASLSNVTNGLSRFLGEGEPSPLNASRYSGRPYADSTPATGVAGPNSRPYADTTPVAGPSGLTYTEPPPTAYTEARPYSEAVAGPARFPHAPPPRQYHPGQFEGATVPITANPPPPYMPGTYTAPAPQAPATRANYYPHFPPPNTMPNPSYANAAHIAQAARPPTSGVQTMPQSVQSYAHFVGRYPNPTIFYPPYQ